MNLDFVKANKTAFIVGGVILLAVIIYFVFKNDDEEVNVGSNGCPSSFTIKPSSGIAQVVSTTYSVLDGKWFKQFSGSALGVSGQLPKQEISEAEFLDACKNYKTPATGNPTGNNIPSTARAYSQGGVPYISGGCQANNIYNTI